MRPDSYQVFECHESSQLGLNSNCCITAEQVVFFSIFWILSFLQNRGFNYWTFLFTILQHGAIVLPECQGINTIVYKIDPSALDDFVALLEHAVFMLFAKTMLYRNFSKLVHHRSQIQN